MFARISFGWELVVQSFRVLREEKRLIVFPLLSGIACLIVMAGFAIPLWGTPQAEALLHDRHIPNDPLSYVLVFLFYFVNYFVIVFFNSAWWLALIRFRGETPTVGAGLRIAMARAPQIAGGPRQRHHRLGAEDHRVRSDRVRQVVAGLLGMAWSAVSYLVVPVLVVEKAGPIEAVKRSTALLKKTWARPSARTSARAWCSSSSSWWLWCAAARSRLDGDRPGQRARHPWRGGHRRRRGAVHPDFPGLLRPKHDPPGRRSISSAGRKSPRGVRRPIARRGVPTKVAGGIEREKERGGTSPVIAGKTGEAWSIGLPQ